MVDQSFDRILEGVAARHEGKGWRSVFGRASDGVMSVIGIRRGPKIAESVERTAAARAAYEEALEAEDFSEFDEPEPVKPAEPPRAASQRAEKRPEPPQDFEARHPGDRTRRTPEPTPPGGNRGTGSATEAGAAYARTVREAQPGAPSTDPYDIAMELDILSLASVKDLLEARRNFARTNHPDRVAIGFRSEATTRMQIANRLVDDAVARMSGQARR
ncbi:hypothetical protein [Jiella avicenniae]|uniref:J domain-containing protein n=1 Tax=Jiella avicenniae TaxID=2907202 RepID=A0A9X1T5P3_9HYPH|nr:hypothetical protein [Jiella avicenniae]MCE7029771.1 hypothetical protein [Jiella avicenniae]